MKTATFYLFLFSLFTFHLLPETTLAQNQSNNSELSIPWDEFKKLINLDKDEIVISLEMYQKLLAQIGVTTTKHTIKNGNVILTRNEFKNLVSQMKPPNGPEIVAPFDYLITKAVYAGKMEKKNTDFTGTFTVHVLKKNAYVKIPLLRQNIALAEIKVNGKQGLVLVENGYHNIVLSKAGEYKITANFSIKSNLNKGPNKIDLSIQQVPITLLSLDLPLKDIDLEIPEAQQIRSSIQSNRTIVSAVLSQKSSISIRWRKKAAVTEKIPPKLYSEIYHLISIDDDALKINSDINYNILHSEVDAVDISIPDNMNVLSVTGEGVGEWQEISRDEKRFIIIPFTYGKKGNVIVRVNSETPLTENSLANLFTGFRTIGTVRETGFIGVELNTSAEVIVSESSGLEKISIQKLPQVLINKSVKPLVMGFKYLKHPYNVILDIKKHEKVGVPLATINSASVVTLFTEDGKIVHRLVYQVRNSSKQFLQIILPENADVWSVFVDNQPVESSINSEGKLLVPLIRSRSVNNRLNTFPVEIIYNKVDDDFSIFGNQKSDLPAVDLLVSQLIWSVYLPNDYSYKYFSSTLEKEEIIRNVNLFAGEGREYDETAMDDFDPGSSGSKQDVNELKKVYKGKDYRSKFRNNALKEEQMQSQVDAELEFSRRLEDIAQEAPSTVYGGVSTGIMPIQIEVPTSGQVYRFAKSIIKPEDELSFSVIYTQMWINDLVKWISLIVLLLVIYSIRKKLLKILNWLKAKSAPATQLLKENKPAIKGFINSYYMAIALFVLVMIFSSISFYITVILLALFLTSLINLIINYSKKKKEEKSKLGSSLSEIPDEKLEGDDVKRKN